MVICKKSIEKISIAYRVMTLHYGYTIDTVHKLRQLIYALNSQHIKDWCGFIWTEDFLFLDDELLSILMKDISDYPVLRGNPSDDEKDEDHYWGEWNKTSLADRETFEKVAGNPYWTDLVSVDSFNYKDHIDSVNALDIVAYIEEMIENHFIFEYDFRHRDDSKPRYRDELSSRKLINDRDKKLNQIL